MAPGSARRIRRAFAARFTRSPFAERLDAAADDHWQDAGYEAIVIGAGAAAYWRRARLAELGRRTLLLEKNRKPGVKILISGGTAAILPTIATSAA